MSIKKYTTELSKGQGMVPETLAILNLWTPSMSVAELKSTVVREGSIGRAHDILHDFITEMYWGKYETGATVITRQDALEFIDRAANNGIITGKSNTACCAAQNEDGPENVTQTC